MKHEAALAATTGFGLGARGSLPFYRFGCGSFRRWRWHSRMSAFGTKRASPDRVPMSAFGGKADITAYDAVDGARSAASKCYRLVASKSERFKEVRPGKDDGVLTFWRNWRGHDDVMQTRSIRGSGEPAWVIASLNASLRLGPDPRRALWPAATSVAQTGRTHDRTRPMLQMRQKVLAKAPSTHDPNRTCSSTTKDHQ